MKDTDLAFPGTEDTRTIADVDAFIRAAKRKAKARPVRPIRVEGDLAYVPLTRGCEAVVDAADADLVAGFNWYCVVPKNRLTAYAHTRMKDENGKLRRVITHRLINGTPDEMITDHISGNGLDNRRCNLRSCTPSQNQANRSIQKSNKSGLKGVYWCNIREKWKAQIYFENLHRHLGYFSSAQEAHDAYAQAALKHHGEFARTA